MRINKVDTLLLRVPLAQRTITDAQSSVDHVEFLQVVLGTDDGVTGYGMNWSYTKGLRAAQVVVDGDYAPLLLGRDPERRKEIVRDCYLSNHFVGRVGAALVALAAVELALWDLVLRRQNLPLFRYLGPCRDKVKAYSTDGGWLGYSEDELVRDCARLVERGFDAVKIKLGRHDPRDDFERVRAVRRALGDRVRIMTDVNCAWPLGVAQFWGNKLAELDVAWLEEPLHPFDVAGHAALARAIPVPIALGETVYTRHAFKDFIERGAVHVVQADATKLSGIDEWIEVAALAAASSLSVVPHTNVQQKLHVQLAAATPAVAMVENCYESLADIWEEPIHVRDGFYELPELPGVGLQIREDVVARTRVG